ncbi:MAG: type II toxin-antitoxin system HicB family antitoxin [Sulfurimonas sp.]|nr:type II toxin-antitoxin system HicB family antitoxin [Sulfurimonas sp.]
MHTTLIFFISLFKSTSLKFVIKKVAQSDGRGWFAYYKDIKGVMGDGETSDEALNSVQEAFKAYLTEAIANKENIFEPHSQEKSLRINISMPERILKKIDEYIEPLHISRSAFIQKLALREINGNAIKQ